MKNPCYDTATKTDCPRRCAGCAVECPDWQKFIAEKEQFYKKRMADHDVASAIDGVKFKPILARQKKYKKWKR